LAEWTNWLTSSAIFALGIVVGLLVYHTVCKIKIRRIREVSQQLNEDAEARQTRSAKTPYQKPAFRFGRVFETRALPREQIIQSEDHQPNAKK